MSRIFDTLDEYLTREDDLPSAKWANLYPSESAAKINIGGKSQVIGTCMRRAWLRFKTSESQMATNSNVVPVLKIGNSLVSIEPRKVNANSEWTFLEGRRIENSIIDVARNAGIFYKGHKKFAIPVTEDISLVGEIDAIFKVDNELYGIEIKSTSGYMAESEVFGTPANRKKGFKGKPKWDHLLQTAVYAWYYRDHIKKFKILYFLRGKSLREEFLITLKKPEKQKNDEDWKVLIDGRDSGLNVSDVLGRARTLVGKIRKNELPDRDYDLIYDDNKMNELVKNHELPKTKTEAWKKYIEREEQYEKFLDGKKPVAPRRLKRPDHGDAQCSWCVFRDICYDSKGTPNKF